MERCEASFRTNVVFFITHSEKDHEVKELTHRFEILHEEVNAVLSSDRFIILSQVFYNIIVIKENLVLNHE